VELKRLFMNHGFVSKSFFSGAGPRGQAHRRFLGASRPPTTVTPHTICFLDSNFPSYDALRRIVAKLLHCLLGSVHRYTLGGLRGGGATAHFLLNKNMPLLQRRGRWTSLKSLDHYIQIQGAIFGVLHWDPASRERVSRIAMKYRALL
jgi:hypothetical protein